MTTKDVNSVLVLHAICVPLRRGDGSGGGGSVLVSHPTTLGFEACEALRVKKITVHTYDSRSTLLRASRSGLIKLKSRHSLSYTY